MNLKRKYREDDESSKQFRYPSKELLSDVAEGKVNTFLDYLCGFPKENHYLYFVENFVYPIDLKSVCGNNDDTPCLWLNTKGPKIDNKCLKRCKVYPKYHMFLKTLLLAKTVQIYADSCSLLLRALRKYASKAVVEEHDKTSLSKDLQSFQQLCRHQPDLVFCYMSIQFCLRNEWNDVVKDIEFEGSYSDDIYSTVIKIYFLSNEIHLCGNCIKAINENCLQTDIILDVKTEGEIILSQTNRDVDAVDSCVFSSKLKV